MEHKEPRHLNGVSSNKQRDKQSPKHLQPKGVGMQKPWQRERVISGNQKDRTTTDEQAKKPTHT